MNEELKAFFKELIETGKVKGHIEGPKDNVLVCDTLVDWCTAGSLIGQAGYDVVSPGGFGGSHPTDRKNTYNKIWRSGTVCASVIEKKILCFTLQQNSSDYCQIHSKRTYTKKQ